MVAWPFEGTKTVYFAAQLDNGEASVKNADDFFYFSENYYEDFDIRDKYEKVYGIEPASILGWYRRGELSLG